MKKLSEITCFADNYQDKDDPTGDWRCLDFQPRGDGSFWASLYQCRPDENGPYTVTITLNDDITEDLNIKTAKLMIKTIKEAIRVEQKTRKYWKKKKK